MWVMSGKGRICNCESASGYYATSPKPFDFVAILSSNYPEEFDAKFKCLDEKIIDRVVDTKVYLFFYYMECLYSISNHILNPYIS